MLVGPFVNGSAVLFGGLAGAFLGTRLPERVRTAMPQTFGLASMGLGIFMIVKLKFLPAVILSIVLGSMIGEVLFVEKGLGKAGSSARGLIDKIFPPVKGLSQAEFLEKYVAILVLFCASGTGIFGAMQEGMTGDPSILFAKSILDLFTSAIFATALGYAVAAIFVPQLVVQLILAFAATMIFPLTTPNMMADFSAVGGLIMFATGFRICGIKSFPVANMIPALILAMPISYLWATYVVH